MSTGVFFLASKCDWRSRSLEKTCSFCTHSWGRRSYWLAVSYCCPDQLLTPNFSGGSPLNGTPGGGRWARVLRGQIGWLSDPLRRVHAGCSETGSTNEFGNSNSWKARKKIAPPKTHHEIHSRPAAATNSRRRAAKHVPRVSPHSPASVDSGFVKIGLVQLSQ